MTNIEKITALQNVVQKNKEELIRLEEQQKNLNIEKQKVLDELKELNISESELNEKISSMEENLKIEIETIENELK